MRILMINPNMTQSMTDTMTQVATDNPAHPADIA